MFKSSFMFNLPLAGQLRAHVANPLYRNGYALTLSSGVTSVLGLAYWLLAARFYPAEVVGTNSAAIAAMTFLAGLAGLNLDGAYVRFVPHLGAGIVPFVRRAYLLTAALALAVAGLFLAGVDLWSPALAFLVQRPGLAAWFIVGVAAWCIFVQQDGLLTGMRRTGWVPVENTVYAVVKLILLVLFARALPAYGIFVSWTLPALLLILPVNWLIFRRLMPAAGPGAGPQGAVPTAQIVRYVGANYVGVLCLLAYTMLPPVMVLQLAGSEASAHFYLPWVMAGLLRLVAANMSTSLVVEASLDPARTGAHFRRASINTLRLVGPVVLLVVAAAPYLLLLFGRDYAAGGTILLQLLAVAALPSAFVSLSIGLLRAQNRVLLIVGTYILTTVLVLGLSYVWLMQFGIAGIGLAWIVSQSIAGAFLFVILVRTIRSTPNAQFATARKKGGQI